MQIRFTVNGHTILLLIMTLFSAKAEVHVCVCKWFFSHFPFVENQPRTTCSEMTAFTLQRKVDDECASHVIPPVPHRHGHGPSLCAIETDARAFNSVPQGDLRQLCGDLVAAAFSHKCMGLQSAVMCAGTETAQRRLHTPAKEFFLSAKRNRNKKHWFPLYNCATLFCFSFFLPPLQTG